MPFRNGQIQPLNTKIGFNNVNSSERQIQLLNTQKGFNINSIQTGFDH